MSAMRLHTDPIEDETTSKMSGGSDRRQHRRHDFENQGIVVQRCDSRATKALLGRLIDISAGGVRIRTDADVKPDHQVRVRLELPAYAGISPFVDTRGDRAQPRRDWEGWLTVTRVRKVEGGQTEIGGRLVDMEEMDRGMLGLYLSTQPIAA